MIKSLCYFQFQNYDFSAPLKSFSNFLSVSDRLDINRAVTFRGLDSRSDCNVLLTEWRKRRLTTRRHRHDGALWPFTFLPQKDRVVLPVTEEKT